MADKYTYDRRGVSATKDEVHAAIQHMDKGLYPNAFCKILPDIAAGDPAWCNLMHADTAGTKTSLAYLYWKETGDQSVWAGIAQDAMVMNLDDMACVGCTDQILLSSTIGRNKNHIPGEVIAEIIQATTTFVEKMQQYGIHIHLAGGETADVGDIVRTIDVGYTAYARLKRSDLIVNRIQAGDVIVGLASYGQATYETTYNGGMGSNGLTSARHDVFHKAYLDQYPETYDPATDREVLYVGSRRVTDVVNINGQAISIGQLVLSPTRTYLPIIQHILKQDRTRIHGMIHNTGGGLTKVMHFLDGKHVIKNNLLPVPPLFQLIQEESQANWREMYQVFNMGQRLEVYVSEKDATDIIEAAQSFGVEAQVIGRVTDSAQNSVTINSPYGTFNYSA